LPVLLTAGLILTEKKEGMMERMMVSGEYIYIFKLQIQYVNVIFFARIFPHGTGVVKHFDIGKHPIIIPNRKHALLQVNNMKQCK